MGLGVGLGITIDVLEVPCLDRHRRGGINIGFKEQRSVAL